MKKIAFVNQKGGVGKTTTAFNVGFELARRGYGVLLVDLDPSANLTFATGHKGNFAHSLFDFMADDGLSLQDVIVEDERGFDLIPAERRLEKANVALAGEISVELYLRERLNEALGPVEYEYVLFDCAPNLGLLTLNALCATDHLVVVQQLQEMALEGLEEILSIYRKVLRANPDLNFLGIIATFYDKRLNAPKDILADLNEHFGEHLFETLIRTNVRVAESVSKAKAVAEFAPKSFGAEDYKAATDEMLNRITNKKVTL